MDYFVCEFGAVGDGSTDDATSIQTAIDTCSTGGGGRVVLQSSKTYLASSIVLKSYVELHLQEGSVLKASTAFTRFIRPSAMSYAEEKPNAAAKPPLVWLYGYGQENISITGCGAIVGNADSVTRRINPYIVTGNGNPRPTLVYLENCRNIAIRGVSFRKAPFWTLHLGGCQDVVVSSVTIQNDLDCANSDGIDPDHCRNVLIENCRIECADDCIVVKNTLGNIEYGDTENIVVKGCNLVSTSAALKIGTESMGNFRNIEFFDCRIERSNRGLSMQLRDSGNIENVTFKDIDIETRRFSEDWWGSGEPVAITALPRLPHSECGIIRNVRFLNISCDSENSILLCAEQPDRISGVTFDGVRVRLSAKTKWHRPGHDLRPGVRTSFDCDGIEPFHVHNIIGLDVKNTAVYNELSDT